MIPLLKYKLKDANWNGYRNRLDHRFAKLLTSDLTSRADVLSQTMLSVADDMFPLKKRSVVGIPSPPWWDQECSRALQEGRGAEILQCRNMSQDNFINLSKMRASFGFFAEERIARLL
ncbi:hypothetical protein EVAR_75930_1 [Eumeta japonica]|uniref:Uncharacterized protein n=1 Tax=Eumeta variegata TaxID=151549 RepID=A0A4C1UXH6_EUMVA|nr:hypothetical protein EVAR_75930_1 [Eumeta japonica]